MKSNKMEKVKEVKEKNREKNHDRNNNDKGTMIIVMIIDENEEHGKTEERKISSPTVFSTY